MMNRFYLVVVLLLAVIVRPVDADAPGASLGSAAGDDLLPAAEAFALSVEQQADDIWVFRWRIAEDYYLYRDRLDFELRDAGDAELLVDEANYGAAEPKDDPFFGEVEVYYQQASVRIPVSGTPPDDAQVRVEYQGCNEPLGVCYPPQTTTVEAGAIAQVDAGGGGSDSAATASAAEGAAGGSAQERIAATLADAGLLWTVVLFLGFGVLLSLTPCVFPMVPILAGVIAGDRQATGSLRGALLACAFVGSMAATYAILGIAVGLTGASIQAWFQQPLVLYAFAALFVLLALAMFGLFDLETLPGGLRERFDGWMRRMPAGTFGSASLLGALSALVVGPCVTPPLIGALIYIADTGDPVTGGTALFALGLGMGVPLVIAGGSAGHLLPRAGAWMKTVRTIFGVGLLALAIWLLQRAVPVPVTMVLWAVLLIVTGVQLGALNTVAAGWPRLWKGTGLVMVVYGIILLVGAAAGSQSLLQPLRGIAGSSADSGAEVEFRDVDNLDELNGVLAEARADDRPVMVDVSAEWCVSCQEMEAFTFPDPTVQQALGDTLLVRVDVTDNDAADQEILERFGVFGPPALLFYGPDGVERRGYRVVGFMRAGPFAEHVRQALPETAS